MTDALRQGLFREPGRRWLGLLEVGVGVCFLAIYAAYEVHGDGPLAALLLSPVWFFGGAAELLPADRRRLAGWLRAASLAVGLVFVPAYLLGYLPR